MNTDASMPLDQDGCFTWAYASNVLWQFSSRGFSSCFVTSYRLLIIARSRIFVTYNYKSTGTSTPHPCCAEEDDDPLMHRMRTVHCTDPCFVPPGYMCANLPCMPSCI